MALVGSSDGIQKLLAAEQEAQRIVSEARKGTCRVDCVEGDGTRPGFWGRALVLTCCHFTVLLCSQAGQAEASKG